MGRHNFGQAVVMGTHTDESKAVYEAAMREFDNVAVIETAPEEKVIVVEFVSTEAHNLLAKVVGTETAQLATEAEAIDLLEIAMKSGISLVAENEIVEFLLGLEEEVSWPTEPRVGTLVNGFDFGDAPIECVAGGSGAINAAQCSLIWETKPGGWHWGNIEIDRPFDAIAIPVKEETVKELKAETTITERVAAVAAEVKAAAKAAKKINIFSDLYKDASGRYHAPKGQSFYLVHQINGLVQSFRTLKAVSGYLQNGWKITLQRISA